MEQLLLGVRDIRPAIITLSAHSLFFFFYRQAAGVRGQEEKSLKSHIIQWGTVDSQHAPIRGVQVRLPTTRPALHIAEPDIIDGAV